MLTITMICSGVAADSLEASCQRVNTITPPVIQSSHLYNVTGRCIKHNAHSILVIVLSWYSVRL